MRMIFMGTPEFAVPSLRRLIEEGHTLLAVFTQPDKPKGRGHRTAPPPVKELALSAGIPVFQPESLRDEETFLRIRDLSPEIMIVVAYGKMLPLRVLEIPARGCVNVHASLLPRYRGAGPIQWSVLNGDTVTGVTTQKMAQGMDTGDILLQKSTPIGENETAGELQARLAVLGAELLSETLIQLERDALTPIPQREEESTRAPMLTKALSPIDWGKPARALHNQIRGLSPWPCAETALDGRRLKIYRSEIVSTEGKNAPPGTILPGKAFTVQTGEGVLRVTEAQAEGSRRMGGEELLRGFHPRPERVGE